MLQRLTVFRLKWADLARTEQPLRGIEELFRIDGSARLAWVCARVARVVERPARVERLVDLGDDPRERSEPRKVAVIQEKPKQLGRMRRPVRLFVVLAHKIEQRGVKGHQPGAENFEIVT